MTHRAHLLPGRMTCRASERCAKGALRLVDDCRCDRRDRFLWLFKSLRSEGHAPVRQILLGCLADLMLEKLREGRPRHTCGVGQSCQGPCSRRFSVDERKGRTQAHVCQARRAILDPVQRRRPHAGGVLRQASYRQPAGRSRCYLAVGHAFRGAADPLPSKAIPAVPRFPAGLPEAKHPIESERRLPAAVALDHPVRWKVDSPVAASA